MIRLFMRRSSEGTSSPNTRYNVWAMRKRPYLFANEKWKIKTYNLFTKAGKGWDTKVPLAVISPPDKP